MHVPVLLSVTQVTLIMQCKECRSETRACTEVQEVLPESDDSSECMCTL